MRILFISKRHPQQRDLLDRPYGRFHYLPAELAALGHDVRVLLISHRHMESERRELAGVSWLSRDVRSLGLRQLLRVLIDDTAHFRPDWIVGCSDTWCGWLAHRFARRSGARLAIDAYDNYEAYMPWNLPLHSLWRRAIRASDVVIAAGPQLAQLMQSHRRRGRAVDVVPMAADPGFERMDKGQCRARLGLPADAPLIGYSGGWASNRGTDIIVDSFRLVREQVPHARLVLSGRPPADVCSLPGVRSLGYLADAQLPVLLNAIDVAYVITADTSFGRYSYPAKLCEAMACGVPIVATASEPVRWMMKDHADCLADVGSAPSIADLTLCKLALGRMDYGALPTWREGARNLAELLET